MKLSKFFTVIALGLSALSVQAQPVVTNGPPTSPVLAGSNYSFTYTYTGSPAPSFTYTGTLPPNVTLSSSGVLSGTLTSATGIYSGTITASYTGTAGSQVTLGTQNYSIDVTNTIVQSVPEGVIPYSLPGSVTTTYFSLPFTCDPVYTGTVSSVSPAGNTISVADASPPFVNPTVGVQLASLATASEPFFVKFLTGAETGRVLLVTANTNNSVTLDISDNTIQSTSLNTTGFAVTPGGLGVGDTFEVFPGTTLGGLFGDNTTINGTTFPLLLNGGVSAFYGDTVGIYNTLTHAWQLYYYSTNTNCWVLNGSTVNKNNTPIYPYGAFEVTRRSSGALAFVPTSRVASMVIPNGSSTATLEEISVPVSRVAEVPILTKTTSGSVVYGSTCYPVDMTLSQLDAYGLNQQQAGTWIQTSSPFTADTISVWNSLALKYNVYYQQSGNTTSGWRLSTDPNTDKSTITIPAGSPISVYQRNTVSGKLSFLQSVMPYSLN